MKIDSGIPTIEKYGFLIKSDGFSEMEGFSNNFLKSHKSFLNDYSQRWVADPLHQWSRQWEYPYVFNAISEYVKQNKKVHKILDAGSGITFFPYFVMANINDAQVTCSDYDFTLQKVFSNVNRSSAEQVEFIPSDIHTMPYEDSTFDVIYCISVLEHTRDFEIIIREFKRILKVDGILIVTFDISIDGMADIPPQNAEELLQILSEYFSAEYLNASTLTGILKSPEILTTNYIRDTSPRLLPWKYTFWDQLKSLLECRIQKKTFKALSCFCSVFKKTE